jgi:predicted transcriptional regulator of viral defense system
MIVKSKLSPLEKIRKILADQRGVLLTSDLAKLDIPRTYLSILEQSKEIERVSRGVYKTPSSIEDEMFIFQTIYKSSVYSHETALYLHDLTDRSPLSYSISAPVGYHSVALNQSGHKIFYVNRKLFNLGVVLMKSPQGNEIRVTNLERTICDVARSRNQMDVQFVNVALKRYVARKDKNINLLYAYAKLFRVQKIIRQYIEVLL